MLPTITIGNFNLQVIYLFAFCYLVVFLFVFWLQSKKDLKNNTLFDVAFISFLSSVIVSRMLGMLSHLGDYQAAGWSFLPISIKDEQFLFFQHNPWTFFGIGDGNFLYIGLFFGVIIGAIILYLNSNQKKSVYLLFERVVIAYCAAAILILVGQFLAGIDEGAVTSGPLAIIYPDGSSRYPLQLMQIAVLVVFLVYKFGHKLVLGKRQIAPRSIVLQFFVYFGLSELFLRTLSTVYVRDFFNALDLTQIFALLIMIIGLFLAFAQVIFRPGKQQQEANVPTREEFKRMRLINQNYAKIDAVNKYNLSYTKRKVK